MKKQLLAAALCLGLMAAVEPAPAQAEDGLAGGKIKHVLLVSVDGLHALDVANYVRSHPGSALDELSEHGVTFSNARTPANSDSFPGLLALVTGGSPRTHGLFYDYSYDRTIWAPDNKTCSGPPGTQMIFDESIDVYVNGVSQNVIDPNMLPRYIDSHGQCSPLYPHDAIRTNTVFEVIKEEHAGRTAWADKHPAYDLVNGRSGKGVDELYTPEITNVGGYDNTLSVVCTVQNDTLKVKAVLNEIQGWNHEGTKHVGVPAVLGLNFQAVSVGQKLIEPNTGSGGYLDGAGTPSELLTQEIEFVDASIGKMVDDLKDTGEFDSTMIVITAKHGQSPIDSSRFLEIPSNDPATLLDSFLPASESQSGGQIGPTEDDVSLLWLNPGASTLDAVSVLENNATAAGIGQILYGPSLETVFNMPGLPAQGGDPRTPDIIVVPHVGVIYTGSTKKQSEHGGFALDDTNVMLLVSNPALHARTVTAFVETSQVAPTVLKILDLDADRLDAVRVEGTAVLPGLDDNDRE